MLREKYYLPKRPENVNDKVSQLHMGKGTEAEGLLKLTATPSARYE